MIESVIKNVLRTKRRDAPTVCPDAEVLAAYIDRSLAGPALRGMEEHLAGCEACLDQVILCTGEAEVPVLESGVDVVVRFFDRTVEVLRGLAEVQLFPEPAMVATRTSAEDRAALKCVRFGRQFDDLNIEVEVEATSDGLGEIRVEPSAGSAMAEDVRVTLLSDLRELDSSLARGGKVSFDAVEFGDYVVRLSKQGRTLGEVSLRLEAG